MKPELDFDPMFHVGVRQGYGPICTVVTLLIVSTLGGTALRAGSIPASRHVQWTSRPRAPIVLQGPVQDSRAGEARPPDRFVIVAPAEIDPEMVVRARDDIDPEMVFNPETGRRGLAGDGRGDAVRRALPVPVPNPVQPRPRR